MEVEKAEINEVLLNSNLFLFLVSFDLFFFSSSSYSP